MRNQIGLKPTPHWSKEIIKNHKIPINFVARFLDLSFHYVSNLLSGVCNMTPENEEKIREFVKQIEESE